MTTETPVPTAHRILVVDDNLDSADSLALLLEMAGHTIAVAYDGSAAVELAEEFRPDVVLLDIGLPKLNGYEVCQHIRAQDWSSNTLIVALTGWGQEKDRNRSQAVGFDHHMVKPVDYSHLKQLIDALPAEGARR